MKIHPRELLVRQAENDLRIALLDIKTRHGLTEAEALRMINTATSEWIGGVAKHSIREERHGNTDTPGGLE